MSFIIRFVIVFTHTRTDARWPAPRAISDEKRQPVHTARMKIEKIPMVTNSGINQGAEQRKVEGAAPGKFQAA